MVYSYIRFIKEGACANWLKTSKWLKYVALVAVVCGTLSGAAISNVVTNYSDISRPKTITVDNVDIKQSVRALEVTVTNSYPKQCEKISYHMLLSASSKQYYSLTPGIGGSNYTPTAPASYTVDISIPESVPSGDYDYNIRTIYLCNFYGITLYYPSQTAPVRLHIN